MDYTMNAAIANRMKQTGWTFEKVVAELKMMADARRRYETGQLTPEDKRQIAECRRHWQPQGRGR